MEKSRYKNPIPTCPPCLCVRECVRACVSACVLAWGLVEDVVGINGLVSIKNEKKKKEKREKVLVSIMLRSFF